MSLQILAVGFGAGGDFGQGVSTATLNHDRAPWVRQRTGLALRERIEATLALGPKPNPYRRIKREGDTLRLAIKDWRIRFAVEGRTLRILELYSGYRHAQLAASPDPAVEPHREFAARWPPAG